MKYYKATYLARGEPTEVRFSAENRLGALALCKNFTESLEVTELDNKDVETGELFYKHSIRRDLLVYRSEVARVLDRINAVIHLDPRVVQEKVFVLLEQYKEAVSSREKAASEVKSVPAFNSHVQARLNEILANRPKPPVAVLFYDPRGNAVREVRFPMSIEIGRKVTYGDDKIGVVVAFQGYKNEMVCINSEDNMKCAIVPRLEVHCANATPEQAIKMVLTSTPGAAIFSVFTPYISKMSRPDGT